MKALMQKFDENGNLSEDQVYFRYQPKLEKPIALDNADKIQEMKDMVITPEKMMYDNDFSKLWEALLPPLWD